MREEEEEEEHTDAVAAAEGEVCVAVAGGGDDGAWEEEPCSCWGLLARTTRGHVAWVAESSWELFEDCC